jgi:hypothetical protein
MCDPGCDCGQLTEEDIECENPRSRRAKKWRSKHAKTPCGLKIYFPHDDEDDYPKPIPIPPMSEDLSHIRWKPKGRSLPTLEECLTKLSQASDLPTGQSKDSCTVQASSTLVQPPTPLIPCMMFTPIFPQTEPVREPNQSPSQAFVQQTTIDHMGRRTPLSPIEEVLNWQSKNALAQNDMLHNLDHKVDQVTTHVQTITQRLDPL